MPTREVRTVVPRPRVALVLAAVLYGLVVAGAQSGVFTGRVVGVVDGDTIDVLRDGRQVRIRLDGIDAPESGQDFGQRAKQFTSSIVFGKTVDVHVKDVDRYGRLVARVIADGRDVSVAIVDAGLAWHFIRYSNDPLLTAAQTRAEAAKIGLWTAPQPTPPWTFRDARSAPASRAPAVSRATEQTFFGNTRSRVVHAASCPSLRVCKYCTQEFASVNAAVAAGYRPHGGRGGCIEAR